MNVDDRADLQADLFDLEQSLAALLQRPALPNPDAQARRVWAIQITVEEIDRVERLLGERHLRVV